MMKIKECFVLLLLFAWSTVSIDYKNVIAPVMWIGEAR
jgi:hypothetical protein